jgi:hypothetical protein
MPETSRLKVNAGSSWDPQSWRNLRGDSSFDPYLHRRRLRRTRHGLEVPAPRRSTRPTYPAAQVTNVLSHDRRHQESLHIHGRECWMTEFWIQKRYLEEAGRQTQAVSRPKRQITGPPGDETQRRAPPKQKSSSCRRRRPPRPPFPVLIHRHCGEEGPRSAFPVEPRGWYPRPGSQY